MSEPRAVIEPALKLIKGTEKTVLKPYEGEADEKGVWTIGTGHVIRPGEEWMMEGITEAQAQEIYARDVAIHSKWIQIDAGPKVVLDDFVYGALASMCFNVGPRTLTIANSITSRFRAGDIKGGVLNMYKFSLSGKPKIYRDGLFYRRLAEMVLALDHEFVPKPDNCKQAAPLFVRLAKHGDIKPMKAYFAARHRKDLCKAC